MADHEEEAIQALVVDYLDKRDVDHSKQKKKKRGRKKSAKKLGVPNSSQ